MPANRPVRLFFALLIAVALILIGWNAFHRYLNTALITAIRDRDVAATRQLLARGADPNYQLAGPAEGAHTPPPEPALSLALMGLEAVTAASTDGIDQAGSDQKRAQAKEIVLLLIRHGARLQESYALVRACRLGDVALAREMLDRGADARATDNADALNAAIQYATSFGTTFNGAGRPTTYVRTPEEKAEVARHQEASRQLIALLRARGAQLSLTQAQALGDKAAVGQSLGSGGAGVGQEGYVAMSKAAQTGDVALLRQLIAQGVDPRYAPQPNMIRLTVPGTTYSMPLDAAVQGNHVEAAKVLLEHGAEPNTGSSFDWPALTWAAYNGNTAMVQLLLAHGAKVNPSSPDTPLEMAIARHHLALVHLLLTHGADPNQPMGSQEPILSEALWLLPEVVPDLLRHGAQVSLPPGWHAARDPGRASANVAPSTPLVVALFYAPQYEATLARAGAKIGRDRSSVCAAMVRQKRIALLPKLLAYAADINGIDEDHMTALRLSIDSAPEFVKTLLEHGADPNLGEHASRPPLAEAAMIGNVEAVRLLLAHGANVNGVVRHGHTALYWARKKGHAEVATLLEQAGGKE